MDEKRHGQKARGDPGNFAVPPFFSERKAFFVGKGNNMTDAIGLLRDMASQTGRLPKKTDFAPEDAARIKSALGPWPRALEAAGLKAPREKSSLDKNREKRKKQTRQKRRANEKERKKTV